MHIELTKLSFKILSHPKHVATLSCEKNKQVQNIKSQNCCLVSFRFC